MKKLGSILLCLLLLGGITAAAINLKIWTDTKEAILSPEQAAELTDVDCILVLGCKVYQDGTPGDMLADRLRRGVELYQAGVAPRLLMSGDRGSKLHYDEVGAMQQYALQAEVPPEVIFLDEAGFSTYESLYRAQYIFGARKIVIVTQQYHLYRALYIAQELGLEAYGVASDYHTYAKYLLNQTREMLARCKDFIKVLFRPEPPHLGNKIPLTGGSSGTP